MIEKIADSLSGKAEWFDVIELAGSSTPITFKHNRIYSIQEKQNRGFGVRVNKKGRTGFSFTNDINSLQQIIDQALTVSQYGDIEPFKLPSHTRKQFDPYSPDIASFNISDELLQGENALQTILKEYPRAYNDLHINKAEGTVKLINSNGVNVSYRHSYYSISLSTTYILDDGSKIDLGESKASLSPEAYKELPSIILEKMKLALNNRKLESGKVPVIMTPGAFSRLLGIIASGLNAKSVSKGISPFTKKMGEKIFNNNFSFYNDPVLKNSPYSYPFDDEGVNARKKALIEQGVIKNFVTDLKYAEKLNIEPGGDGSRGYASLPSPSFSNILVTEGIIKYSDMLKDIKKGVIVEQFIGLGQSNTLTGDFSANLDMAFLVENGEITGRVKDCMISDNLFNLMAGETFISEEREQNGSILAPYILFPSVNFTA